MIRRRYWVGSEQASWREGGGEDGGREGWGGGVVKGRGKAVRGKGGGGTHIRPSNYSSISMRLDNGVPGE